MNGDIVSRHFSSEDTHFDCPNSCSALASKWRDVEILWSRALCRTGCYCPLMDLSGRADADGDGGGVTGAGLGVEAAAARGGVAESL